MLSARELRKYERQLMLPELGEAGQSKIKSTSVLVVGAGGLGVPVLQYLVAAGVGIIGIADNDLVQDSNLHRQVLYADNDIGKHKAIVAQLKLAQQNKDVKIQIHNTFLTDSRALNIIKNYDIVVDCSDNFPTRYLLNDACIILDKPLVSGSLYKYEGQISVYNYQGGPSYRCIYPESPDLMKMKIAGNIGTQGFTPSIIGSIQAAEVFKIITGIGQVISGEIMFFNILNMRAYYIKIIKNPDNFNIKTLQDYEHFYGTSSNKYKSEKHKRSWIKKDD